MEEYFYFSCRCKDGYTGNGTHCEAVESNYISFKILDLDPTKDYENKTSADYLELTELLEELVRNITGDILSVELFDIRLPDAGVIFQVNTTVSDAAEVEQKIFEEASDDRLGQFILEGNGTTSGDISLLVALPDCASNSTHNCSSDANCREEYLYFSCECKDGYFGNGTYCEVVESNYISFKILDLDPTKDYENKTSADYLELTELLEELVRNITGDILSVELFDVRLPDAGVVFQINTTAADVDSVKQDIFEETADDTLGDFTVQGNATTFGPISLLVALPECDDASTNNCSSGADCQEEYLYFSCACKEGFTGNGTTCEDNDECSNGAADCDSNAVCTNIPGSYTCRCDSGFHGNGTFCKEVTNQYIAFRVTDLDPTIDYNNTSSPEYQALKNLLEELVRNISANIIGVELMDIRLPDAGVIFEINITDSYVNQVKSAVFAEGEDGTLGMFAVADNDTTFGDISLKVALPECSDGTNNCSHLANCTERYLYFDCDCFEGYAGNGTYCEDVDECALELDNCDDNAICDNTPGSFQCQCEDGYLGNGTVCKRIVTTYASFKMPNLQPVQDYKDENSTAYQALEDFLVSLVGNMSDEVTGVKLLDVRFPEGGVVLELRVTEDELADVYDAIVAEGLDGMVGPYTVEGNATTVGNISLLVALPECNDTSTNDCDAEATCVEEYLFYTCVCNHGYTGDGQQCTDIDECQLNQDNCPADADCTNLPGSFRCDCKDGFYGNGTHCEAIVANYASFKLLDLDPNINYSDPNSPGYQQLKEQIQDLVRNISDAVVSAEVLEVRLPDGAVILQVNTTVTQVDSVRRDILDTTTDGTLGDLPVDGNVTTFGDISLLVALPDCSSDTTNNCSSNATCKEEYFYFSCECKDGSTGDGVSCQDIDECSLGLDNCHSNADCTNTEGSYTCTCSSGFTGNGTYCAAITGTTTIQPTVTGTAVDGGWSLWSGWSNCSASCGVGSQERIRQCDSPPPQHGGRNCRGPDRQERPCFSGQCPPGFIDWCSDAEDRCGQVSHGGVCTLAGAGYTCSCQDGWQEVRSTDRTMFLRCEDVDECTTGQHDCNSTFSRCVNNLGNYTCACLPGFTQVEGTCEDINECTAGGPRRCDRNAACTNLYGSFTCVCNDGYISRVQDGTGFPGQCKEKRLFPYGEAEGDLLLYNDSAATGEMVSPIIGVQHGIPLRNGKLCNSIYVTENGVLALNDRITEHETGDKETYRNPEPLNDIFESNRTETCAVLAAFWANNRFTDLEPGRNPKVWYHVYSHSNEPMFDIVDRAILSNFTTLPNYHSEFILVATWQDMAPPWRADASQFNTFQAVLATDHHHTFVLYRYEDAEMTWVPVYDEEHVQHHRYPARIGYVTRLPLYDVEDPNSGEWSRHAGEANAYRMERKVSPTTGRLGRVIYQLDDNDNNYVNPRRACQDWYEAEPDPQSFAADVIGTCPGWGGQAREERGRWEKITSDQGTSSQCYQKIFPLRSGGNQECCYGDKSQLIDTLNRVHDGTTGFLHRYPKGNPNDQTTNHYKFDILPRRWCCEESGSDEYCKRYAAKRPVGTSARYRAVRIANAFGDPHFTSLDGRGFTFNGYGEYVLLMSTSDAPHEFMLQARTAVAMSEGAQVSATVFSAVAVKQPTNDVQVYLSGDDTVRVIVDSTAVPLASIADNSYNQGVFPDGRLLAVYDDTDPTRITGVLVTYTSGISVRVTAVNGLLTFVVGMIAEMEGKLTGLLGNSNGDTNDDFIQPDGSVITSATPSNPSERELFTYGKTWSLKNVAQHLNQDINSFSLFTSYPSDSDNNSPDSYGDENFVPMFFDDGQIFTDATLRQEAEDTCGAGSTECLYDIAVTGRLAVGNDTLQSDNTFEVSKEVLNNLPPVLVVPSELRVEAHTTYTLDISATDEGSEVTLSLEEGSEGSLVRTGPKTARFTWTPEHIHEVFIEFVAEDEQGARTEFIPEVTVCDCHNGGTCDYNNTIERVNGFAAAVCLCLPGFGGEHCEIDIDACEGNPCFPGVQCYDAAAPLQPGQRAYTCDQCPDGMLGNGETCEDINECLLASSDPGIHSCVNADCVNTPGSFSCVCHPGYQRDGDGHHCVDINECRNKDHNRCDPHHGVCVNEEGGYRCMCQPGHTTSDNGTTCTDIDECMNNNGGCERICVNEDGSYKCQCGIAYFLRSDGRTCQELDECAAGNSCEQICTDRVGFYECGCNNLFTLNEDGRTCRPLVNCSSPTPCHPSPVGTCAGDITNGTREEVCGCVTGYALQPDNSCQDIDECALGIDQCDEHGDCVNTVGDYNCSCHTGYQLTNNHGKRHCDDVNECAVDGGGCSDICENTDGSYNCACPDGYNLGADRKTCEDLNECVLGTDDCSTQAECNNTIGGFTCHCRDGFEGDGTACGDIDECVQSDTVACQVGCRNTLGGYLCTCGTGFFLRSDQVSCQDLDECARSTDNGCQQRCTNTVGSFVCACDPGYVLQSDRITCQLQPTTSTVTVSPSVKTSLSTDRASTITTTPPGVTSVFISPAVSRSTGVPPVVLPDEPECGTDCHVQARFLTIGNREQCVCNLGWTGNGTYCELAANGFNLRLRMKNISFVDELNNCSSQEFQDLWPIVFRRLDSYYRYHQNSRISDNYLYCNLQLFLNGSVIAYHTATFKEDSLLTRDDVAAALSQAISADTTNTLGFDPASPGVEELCYRSYCMNGGSCVESGSGDRTCKCPVGFAGIRCERRDDTGLLTRIFGVLGAFLLLLLMVCLCRYWFLVQKRSSKTRYYVPRDSVLGVDSDTSSTTDDMVQRVGPTIFVGRYLPRRGFTNELRRSPSATNPDAHDERLYNEIFGKNDTFKIQRPKWSYLPISGPASTMGSMM
ncbi:uncharacterized protein LOC144859950 [Branchiostoma floridae x Branchiostoma japonicum]